MAKGASKYDLGALKPKAKVVKDDYYFHCGNIEHWKQNYKVYLEELRKKKGSVHFRDCLRISLALSRTNVTLWGYPKKTRGYYFYNPNEDKVFVARTAVFLEKEFLFKGTSGGKFELGEVLPQNDIDQSTGEIAEQVPQGVVAQSSAQMTQKPRRSGRIRHEPERYGFLMTQDNNILLIDNDESTIYAEAMIGPDSKKWLEAMRSNMKSMYTDMNAYYDYEIWQIDVKTAFLNGTFLKDVYMTQPEGFLIHKVPESFSKAQSPSTQEKRDRINRIPYASVVGAIMHVMLCTRSDVSYALSMTSWYQSDPSERYRIAVKNILKYLRKTNEMFLVYGGEEELVIRGYTDASFQSNNDNSRSQSGYVFCLNGDLVDLYCDKNEAIAQAKEPRFHQRSKHILRRFHFNREIIDRGDVKICRISTDDNLTYPLTKPLVQRKHEAHTSASGRLLGICVCYRGHGCGDIKSHHMYTLRYTLMIKRRRNKLVIKTAIGYATQYGEEYE
ncbi:hypothetical protein CRG98_039816 [Punica granatum]|uniref:Retroviral polymerase SH3-like domain-containing protein n=1 Tax=Punica granatum TaxID=22663 RepID=A0A2I0I729_PUNGR|nr:hypothetical protein CRG98_039816 [Punica granatum]